MGPPSSPFAKTSRTTVIWSMAIAATTASIATYYWIEYYRHRYYRPAKDVRFSETDSDEHAARRDETDQATLNRQRRLRSFRTLAAGEHVGFLTSLMTQMWPHIDAAGSKMIVDMVEPMLATTLPGPLANTRFVKCDLGDVPLRLDNVVVHNRQKLSKPSDSEDADEAAGSDGSSVQFDMDVVWDGQCDIQLRASKWLSFGVKEIKLNGRMSVVLKPMLDMPSLAGAVHFGFINAPSLELNFTGLAQVADVAVVDTAIRNVLHNLLASTLVLPSRMSTKLDLGCNIYDMHVPPLGVLRLSISSGRDFPVERLLLRQPDIPDVYCLVQLGGCSTTQPNAQGQHRQLRTSTVMDNTDPVWPTEDATFDFVLSDREQLIQVHAYDQDFHALDPDDDLGVCELPVADLLASPNRTLEVELRHAKHHDKHLGSYVTLHCDLCPLVDNLASLDQKRWEASPVKHRICGMLTVLVAGAYQLPLNKSSAASCVQVSYGSHTSLTSSVVSSTPGQDALNPTYDLTLQVPLTPDLVQLGPAVEIKLLAKGGLTGSKLPADKQGTAVLGTTLISHAALMEARQHTIRERRSVGREGAQVDFCITLQGITEPTQPVVQPQFPGHGKESPAPAAAQAATNIVSDVNGRPSSDGRPMGTIRLTVFKGTGFQVHKKLLRKIDVPDVYCKIQSFKNKDDEAEKRSIIEWQTTTIRDNVAPVWNESKVFSLYHPEQAILLTVHDANVDSNGDTYLGMGRVLVGTLLMAGGTGTNLPVLEKNGNDSGYRISLTCAKVE